jgi:DNA-binding transcriptional LysR family regulator
VRRRLNLRQIEAFKAVIEHGTVSAAAAMLHVSQPAMSKLIAHLETDAALRLFDRAKGRLTPTEQGMRLYAESSAACSRWKTRWMRSIAGRRGGLRSG